MRIIFLIGVLLCLLFSGCAHRAIAVTPAKSQSFPRLLGQRITLVGTAEPWKVGPALQGKDFFVWIDDLDSWPQEYVGRQVQVVGVLDVRHDLPVFVADTPEGRGRMQGIPVPSGTNLNEARQRYVVRDAKWTLIQ